MRLLMIEDDRQLCRAVSYALEQSGYTVDLCHDGLDGFERLLAKNHDLVLLDRMLPGLSGTDLLFRARQMGVHTPVLMITALGQVQQRIEGLDAGADDYISKPFDIEELKARIRAMLRRPQAFAASETICFGDLELDPSLKSLVCKSESCTLSKRESDLLELFMKNGGKTLARGALLSYVWGMDAPVEEGNLENYIHFLRRRLQSLNSGLAIHTRRGVGYIMEKKDV